TVLAEQAGARVRGVYVMDMSRRTTAANAMLAGLGRTRRIILGDTLLKDYTHDEIETVLAHELAHHVHNDLLKGLAAEAAIKLAGQNLSEAEPPAWVRFLFYSHPPISERIRDQF